MKQLGKHLGEQPAAPQPVAPLFIGRGHVFHSRQELRKNSFRYGNFFIFFPISQVRELKAAFRTRFRFFLSFQEQDYLDGKAQNLDQAVRAFMLEQCQFVPQTVWLQTMPRIFSYVFNPVSFWWCYREGILEAVLCEVNNTFGERHFYWVYQGGVDISQNWVKLVKEFHVSPFFPVSGHYDFKFSPPKQVIGGRSDTNFMSVKLNYFGQDGKLSLATYQEGSLTPVMQISCFELLRKYSWMTVFVIYRIHYQALKLWLKKIPVFMKPEPPIKKVTL